jgi:hypothetical protein
MSGMAMYVEGVSMGGDTTEAIQRTHRLVDL